MADRTHTSQGNFDETLALVERELKARHRCLVLAESCTGGLLAERITNIAGSSEWFYGSFVTYQVRAKREMLGLDATALAQHGPVSRSTALAMVEHSLARTSADYAIALTGLAGPDGDGSSAHVGELWIGWGDAEKQAYSAEPFELSASRDEFRAMACELAVAGLVARMF